MELRGTHTHTDLVEVQVEDVLELGRRGRVLADVLVLEDDRHVAQAVLDGLADLLVDALVAR